MSVYSIKNNYLDKVDPFWTCRLLSLKVGCTAILLFICNGFLKSPFSASTFMMTALAGVLATELLPVQNRLKQVLLYFGIITALSMTDMLFGLFSYFRFGLFLFILVYSYLVLVVLAKNVKSATVPTVFILWGIMQLEGGAPTDLVAVENSLLYFYEYALCGAIVVYFFPNFKINVFMSAFIRLLEEDIKNVDNRNFKNSDKFILTALSTLYSKLPFCPDSYKELYRAIIYFQNDFLKNHNSTKEERLYAISVASELIESINEEKKYSLDSFNLLKIKETNTHIYTTLKALIEGYNQCRA